MAQLRRVVKEAVSELPEAEGKLLKGPWGDDEPIRRHGGEMSLDLTASILSDFALDGLSNDVGYFEGFSDRVLDEHGEMIKEVIAGILHRHLKAAVEEIVKEFG